MRNQIMNVMMTVTHTTYAALQLAALVHYCRLNKLASLNEPAALFLRVSPYCKADP